MKQLTLFNEPVKESETEMFIKGKLDSDWCERCEKVTDQTKDPTQKGENFDTICSKCGHRNFHMQGFNYNLM